MKNNWTFAKFEVNSKTVDSRTSKTTRKRIVKINYTKVYVLLMPYLIKNYSQT